MRASTFVCTFRNFRASVALTKFRGSLKVKFPFKSSDFSL